MATRKSTATKRARTNARATRSTNPIKYLSNDDIHAATTAIESAAYAMLSIHQLAKGDDDGFTSVAVKELARSAFRRLDACIKRLEGGGGIVNFATEFDAE